MLSKYAERETIEGTSSLLIDSNILLLRADFLFDSRLFVPMFALPEGSAISANGLQEIVAVATRTDFAEQIVAELLGESESERLGTMPVQGPENLVHAYDPRFLKYDPAEILAISEENKTVLENELFDLFYKGITDFFTKWLCPLLARAAVKICG